MTVVDMAEAADRAPPYIPEDDNTGQAAREAAPLKVLWPSDFGELRLPPQLVRGLMSDGSLVLLYGPSNVGKSTIAVDIGMAIARGESWRGRPVSQGIVLHVAGEGVLGLMQRVCAYQIRRSLGASEAPYGIVGEPLDLSQGESVDRLLATVAAAGSVRLIIIDTLARCAGIDENSGSDMRRVIEGADRIRRLTGATVLIIHHSGKDLSAGARGHSSLRAAVDTELLVQDNKSGRSIKVCKQRDIASAPDMPFYLSPIVIGADDGEAVTACVVEHADSSKHKPSLSGESKSQRDVLQRLRSLVEAGKPLGTKPQVKKILRDQFKMCKSTVNDAVNSLVRKGAITVQIDGQCQLQCEPKEKHVEREGYGRTELVRPVQSAPAPGGTDGTAPL